MGRYGATGTVPVEPTDQRPFLIILLENKYTKEFTKFDRLEESATGSIVNYSPKTL